MKQSKLQKRALQERAVDMLASGYSYAKTATELQLDRKTVAAWVEDEDFSAKVDARLIELQREWRSGLRQFIPLAYKALSEVLQSDNAAAKAKGLDLVFRLNGLLSETPPPSKGTTEISFNIIGTEEDDADPDGEPESDDKEPEAIEP